MPSSKSPSKFLDEGKAYLGKGDPLQASEKLYKAAEEAIKALSQTYANGIWKEVEEKGSVPDKSGNYDGKNI